VSAQAFLDSDAQELVLGPGAFEGPTLGLHPSLAAQQALTRSSSSSSGSALLQQLAQHGTQRCLSPVNRTQQAQELCTACTRH
jgi:hypothetical protein